MKYSRFEELPVWSAAIELGQRVLVLADAPGLRGRGDLRDQLQRAAISVSNNIAEGFERGTTVELITFLYYAKGSAGEVRSMLRLMAGVVAFEHLRSEISDLQSLSESVSRQLAAWLKSLQNSEIKGPKHLTEAVRDESSRRARAAAFVAELERIRMDNAAGA